jgi:hypothetical protein
MVLFPPVRRDPKSKDSWRVVGAFVTGVTIGGLASASLLYVVAGTARWMPAAVRLPTFVVLCSLLLAVQYGPLHLKLPDSSKMIPPSRFRRGRLLGGFLFGAELGLAFRTRIPTIAPYVLAVTVIFQVESAQHVVAVAAGWGAGRSVPLVMRMRPPAVADDQQSLAALERFHDRLTRLLSLATFAVVPVAVLAGLAASSS